MKLNFVRGLVLSGALLAPFFSHAVDSSTDTTGQYLDDATITTRVKTSFAEDKLVKGRDISVRTDNGVVDLTGNVNSRDESSRATDIATKVKGVRAVHNNLTVDGK